MIQHPCIHHIGGKILWILHKAENENVIYLPHLSDYPVNTKHCSVNQIISVAIQHKGKKQNCSYTACISPSLYSVLHEDEDREGVWNGSIDGKYKEQQCGIWSYDKMNMKTSLLWCYAVQFGKMPPEHQYVSTKQSDCNVNISFCYLNANLSFFTLLLNDHQWIICTNMHYPLVITRLI